MNVKIKRIRTIIVYTVQHTGFCNLLNFSPLRLRVSQTLPFSCHSLILNCCGTLKIESTRIPTIFQRLRKFCLTGQNIVYVIRFQIYTKGKLGPWRATFFAKQSQCAILKTRQHQMPICYIICRPMQFDIRNATQS